MFREFMKPIFSDSDNVSEVSVTSSEGTSGSDDVRRETSIVLKTLPSQSNQEEQILMQYLISEAAIITQLLSILNVAYVFIMLYAAYVCFAKEFYFSAAATVSILLMDHIITTSSYRPSWVSPCSKSENMVLRWMCFTIQAMLVALDVFHITRCIMYAIHVHRTTARADKEASVKLLKYFYFIPTIDCAYMLTPILVLHTIYSTASPNWVEGEFEFQSQHLLVVCVSTFVFAFNYAMMKPDLTSDLTSLSKRTRVYVVKFLWIFSSTAYRVLAMVIFSFQYSYKLLIVTVFRLILTFVYLREADSVMAGKPWNAMLKCAATSLIIYPGDVTNAFAWSMWHVEVFLENVLPVVPCVFKTEFFPGIDPETVWLFILMILDCGLLVSSFLIMPHHRRFASEINVLAETF